MEELSFGFLSVLPPIIAIVLALVTKEVISSLMIGIFSGAAIYAFTVTDGFIASIINTFETTFTLMAEKMADNINIILFLVLLGGLVVVVNLAGGSRAYGNWASSVLKSRKSAQLATSALGALIFIDDYFNCLTVGTVMKPVTDKHRISRAKLAYIIDSTAAPVCIIAPISSWAAAVGSNLTATGAFDNELGAFMATVPYNLYAILCIIMVVILSVTNLDFGSMAKYEEIAVTTGDLGAIDFDRSAEAKVSDKGRVFDLLIPIGALIVFCILAMLYTGGYFGQDPAFHSFGAAFGNCDSSKSLVLGGAGSLIVAFLLFVPRKVVGFTDFMEGITEGAKSMVPACVILTLAWTISGICRDLLLTGTYVGDLVSKSNMPTALIPAIIFVVAAFLSFSMGTAWGTFGILIPIIVTVCEKVSPELMTIALAATLAGSVFGDHCSPISDTTILSSTGAGVNHMTHVSTQMIYSFVVAVNCFIGYLAGGLAGGNVFVTLGVGIGCLVISLIVLHSLYAKKHPQKA